MTATRLEPTEAGIGTAADCILDGGVVVAPSDTNLALTLDPWNEAAIERAFRIKNREPTDPLTLFIRDPNDWREWATADQPDVVDDLVEAFWPGPLNIVLSKTDAVPDRVVAGGEMVGWVWQRRVPRLSGASHRHYSSSMSDSSSPEPLL